MAWVCEHIKAKGKPEFTSLHEHLDKVVKATCQLARHWGMDEQTAYYGAMLHDIGKASSVFQKRLLSDERDENPFRHEIASCFFLSLFPESIQPALIEMVVAHHKSIRFDTTHRGILDLDDEHSNPFKLHFQDFEQWAPDALSILEALGMKTSPLDKTSADENYYKTVDYCRKLIKSCGISNWRGLLMAADHFASAIDTDFEKHLSNTFKKPDLSFFNRTHHLYPLSACSADSTMPHTMVVACTGAGKTDYLFRRCRGRVFYTLPFQASINAMFHRVKHDLAYANPYLDIRLLHSSSRVAVKGGSLEEKALQGLTGSAVKILTPHQLASIVFGMRGYEAMILDLKGCDVILDEIHCYTDITQALVLKVVAVLKHIGCHIHIGTATMPSVLYNRILELLGSDSVFQVQLTSNELDKFNRHRVHKLNSWESSLSIIAAAIKTNQKVLVVANRVQNAQFYYNQLSELFPEAERMLIHSRFKRGHRDAKEKQLIGKDESGNPLTQFNTSDKACIVVATQVVEVSLDISFDIMITECAPLDALIQRFGRVHRKRSDETINTYKPVYVLAPSSGINEAKPYTVEVLQHSFNVLPNGEILKENELQQKIDEVFPTIDFKVIEEHCRFKEDQTWTIQMLTHVSKSILFELLEIDSVSCICQSDIEHYNRAGIEEQLQYEIPVRFRAVCKFPQHNRGNKPFIIPDEAYSEELGLDTSSFKKAKTFEFI